MIPAILIAASTAGCVGLYRCSPRPNAQELWATLALAPLLMLFVYAVLVAS